MIFESFRSWLEIKNLGRFGLKIVMCFNFYEIWHLVQIEHAIMNIVLGIDDLDPKL